MMEYSGRTTAYEHKRDDWADHEGPFTPAIQQQTVFNAQWTDCPVEVEDEVRRLWKWLEYGNDSYYYSWDSEDSDSDLYNEETGEEGTIIELFPVIHEYLKSKGVTKCLIHWWW